MQKLFFACLVIVFPYLLPAQQFGGTPPSVKWRQIHTDSARIIFPTGLDSQAQRIASIIHYEAAKQPVPLGKKLRKINIVLQNQTIIANGYVGLGPFRSEFYLTPAMNSFEQGSIPWADQLALHEYRHVQQFNNFHYGISGLMFYLFGQEGYSLAINASVPNWFYEGDAVYNETILSGQGRGRMPLFLNAYPALWRANKHYSWMKLRNGSFKDYVPSHYELGYLLVNYGREKYGLDFWAKVTRDASAFNGLFYPFQHAIKKHAGISYKNFISDAMKYYKNIPSPIYDAREKANEAGPSPVFPLNKKVVTDYLFPYVTEDGSLLYLKKSYNKRPAFYIKNAKGEQWIRIRSIAVDDQFSYRNGKIVYAAFETDPRWTWRNYSVIRMLDIRNGEEKRITRKTKYFAPDISAGGDKIVAVNMSILGKSELHILDTKTGIVQNKIESGDISVFTDPKFISDDSVVCAIRLRNGQMALAIADLRSRSIRRITDPSFNVVGYPCVSDHVIYFTASYGGSDNVFAIKPGSNQVFRLTNWPQGSYFVNVNKGKMVWSSFTAEGYQLQQINEKDIQWQPVDNTVTGSLAEPYPLSHEENVTEVLPDHFPQRNFPVKKYSKASKPFNFHSWRPYYEDPEFTFSLYGENVLNTLQTEIYYLYNQNDRTNAVGANLIYGKWFPYLSIGYQHTFDREVNVQGKVKQWDQSDARAGFNIPLTWIKGRTVSQLNIGSNYYYRQDYNRGFYKDSFNTIRFSYLYHFINWAQQVETATQHIFPRLGYSISLQYRHAITDYTSWQPFAAASLYLPGFYASHSIVFTGAYQETDTLNALFSNRFPYSRGYNVPYFARMWRVSANYHLPLWYPDWGFANILYLQRVRANAFFDFTEVYDLQKRPYDYQQSAGGEIYVDTKWWNQYPLTFGVRVSYLFDMDYLTGKQGVPVFEFILPVSIFPR